MRDMISSNCLQNIRQRSLSRSLIAWSYIQTHLLQVKLLCRDTDRWQWDIWHASITCIYMWSRFISGWGDGRMNGILFIFCVGIFTISPKHSNGQKWCQPAVFALFPICIIKNVLKEGWQKNDNMCKLQKQQNITDKTEHNVWFFFSELYCFMQFLYIKIKPVFSNTKKFEIGQYFFYNSLVFLSILDHTPHIWMVQYTLKGC